MDAFENENLSLILQTVQSKIFEIYIFDIPKNSLYLILPIAFISIQFFTPRVQTTI